MPRPWQPTHFVTFTPAKGEPETWVLMLSASLDSDGVRRAWTKDEWQRGQSGAWACSAKGSWTCEGRATPGGRAGAISVKETSGGFKKVQWIPTHRISFFPKAGGATKWWVVMARPDPYRPGHWSALTHEEWFAQCPAEWSCDPLGLWTWRGMATPKDEPGAVQIEDISGPYPAQPGSGGYQAQQPGAPRPDETDRR
jgi:hypothetical protein